MATPGRSRPVRQSSDAAALRAQPRFATMTYSFAQQMPTLPPRPSQPPPPPPSEDPNFPHLSRTLSPHPTQQHWVSPPGKPTTAAEIVAAKRPDSMSDEDKIHESAKQQAELALYSKLVPTTSAVPRNPGRPLGSGGLRATGSVAASKSRVSTPSSKSSLAQRKEPMASRMRSLSSEASRPQLARKVAKPSRAMSATPPPTDKDSNQGLSNGIHTDEGTLQSHLLKSPPRQVVSNEDKDPPEMASLSHHGNAKMIAPKPREVQTDSRDAYLKSIVSINGHVDKGTPKLGLRPDQSAALRSRSVGESRQTGGEPISLHRQKNSLGQARRLEEAFTNGIRREGVRSPSPMAIGKGRVGGPRRPSAISPPPGSSLPRKPGGREHTLTMQKNGIKVSVKEPNSDAPPGFGGRTSTASKAKFAPRKTEGEGTNGVKPNEREDIPALPQNDRADAFREAINTRRHSSSPRPFPSRRCTTNDAKQNGNLQTSGLRPTEKDNPRVCNGLKGQSRPSFPSKPNDTLGNVSSEERVSLKRRASQGHTNGRKDEKVLETDINRSTELFHSPLNGNELQLNLSKDGSRVPHSAIPSNHSINCLGSMASMESGDHRNDQVDVSQLMPAALSNQSLGLHSTIGRVGPLSIAGSDDDLNRSPSEQIGVSKADFTHQNVNGWCLERNEINCGRTESLVDGLLNQEDSHVPVMSAGFENRSLPSSAAAGLSMIDLMRELQANASTSTMLLNERCEDVVLPPLPNSEEDVRFEYMLRSMGWTPPDEDENSRGNSVGIIQETPARALQTGAGEIDMNGGIRSVQNGNGQSPYYSHFQ